MEVLKQMVQEMLGPKAALLRTASASSRVPLLVAMAEESEDVLELGRQDRPRRCFPQVSVDRQSGFNLFWHPALQCSQLWLARSSPNFNETFDAINWDRLRKVLVKWGPRLALLTALMASLITLWVKFCFCTEWSAWTSCAPALPGAPPCGRGLSHRYRTKTFGQCPGLVTTQLKSCHMGICELMDPLAGVGAELAQVSCDKQARSMLLREAQRAYGNATWDRLHRCGGMQLCCHGCNGFRMAAYVTCEHHQIGPVPMISYDGCFSCFPAQRSSRYDCEGKQFCKKHFGHFDNGSHQGPSLCCVKLDHTHSVSNKPPKFEEEEWEKGPDVVNFVRHVGKDAVLGKVEDFSTFPLAPDERSCQNHCWDNSFCYLYVYLSKKVENPHAQQRCIIWSLKFAEDAGRAAAGTWLPQHAAVSGFKLIPRVAAFAVTATTASTPGSGTIADFQLLVCGAPDLCQDRKPFQLTPTSCKAGEHCLSTAAVAEFVQNIAVPSTFSLHGVRVETFMEASWNLARLEVAVDGQTGVFDRGAIITKDQPLFFTVGCTSEGGDGATAPAGSPCLLDCQKGDSGRKWCYTMVNKSQWGYCAASCKQEKHHVEVRSELTCAELNWHTRSRYNDDGMVCSTSSASPLKGCSGQVAWSEAQRSCKEVGARLCTQKELEEDEAAGTGCGMDRTHIWTNTKCGVNQFMAVAGASRYKDLLEPRCTMADEQLGRTRCCADARSLTITFNREHRDSHSLPTGLSIENSGGLMNWVVVAGENSRGQDGFILQSGLRGGLAPRDSQHLDVLLSGVATAPRGGAIEFYYRIDSERRADQLRFFIDGREQRISGFPASGQIPWTNVKFTFSGSQLETHIFRWRYEKDHSESVGRDVACIDRIVIHDIRGLV
ncbi:unnamed protein product [Symbiodinium natans]|uniref:Uncharacterized protein n=1 Tax=Symbiodinium natans TaxID=878477 RepID=A0A812T556_9DINO|nr:unnamed protein product [Symbiodinium natans]